VLAIVVRLLESTFIRVGNEEYARTNKSFGLTTLKDRHVKINGSKVLFRFRGKSGKDHQITLTNRRLARLVAHCRDLPGQDLFQYLDEDGEPRPIDSGDVNEYLREISGEEFTAKDFRTWAGTMIAAQALRDMGPARTKKEADRNVLRAIDQTASRLGNTRSVCRKYYIHPTLIEAYLEGSVLPPSPTKTWRERQPNRAPLRHHEAEVLEFLKARLGVAERGQAERVDGTAVNVA
jgi:DNA topoisomerase-1